MKLLSFTFGVTVSALTVEHEAPTIRQGSIHLPVFERVANKASEFIDDARLMELDAGTPDAKLGLKLHDITVNSDLLADQLLLIKRLSFESDPERFWTELRKLVNHESGLHGAVDSVLLTLPDTTPVLSKMARLSKRRRLYYL
jgi:hypothetical protein